MAKTKPARRPQPTPDEQHVLEHLTRAWSPRTKLPAMAR
jgi:hypothetical protein